MNRLSIVWILAFVFTGCFSGRDVQILEGESDKAYVSLGHIEVKIPAQLSVWRQGPRYKKILRRELLQRAKPLEADALIHIRYWPDLSEKNFPDGFVYAKAEMIRFQKFPIKRPETKQPVPATS